MSDRSTLTSQNPTGSIPRWLWHGAILTLLAVMTLGAAMVALLSDGLADPPRAGPAIWQLSSPAHGSVPPNYTIELIGPIALPAGPYTLEVAVQVSGGATWGVTLNDAGGFGVEIDGRGFFSVPPTSPDSIPFIHIRPESNHIALNVESSGQGVLRINDEIAWRGIVPIVSRASVHVTGGKTRTSGYTIQRIVLYSSHVNPS